MAGKAHFAFEIRVPLKKEVKDSVGLISDNTANMLSVCTLVEKNILYPCQSVLRPL